MNPIELREKLYGTIREHHLEEEVMLALSMVLVSKAVAKKGGTQMLLMPDALQPEKILDQIQSSIDAIANNIVEKMKHRN